MIIHVDNRYKPKRKKAKAKTIRKAAAPVFKSRLAVVEPYRAASHSHLPSLCGLVPETQKASPVYEGDMLERERVAAEQRERLKKCVAPAFNKGAYTLIATPEQAKWIGRK